MFMMLETREMEELLDNEDHNKLFSASQLLALLLALGGESTSKLEQFCYKISLGFKKEADAMAEQLAKNDVLIKEEAGVIQDWSQQLSDLCETIAALQTWHKDRYTRIRLALDMAAVLQPLQPWSDVQQSLHRLGQILLQDLEEKQLIRDRSGLRGFLVCVNQFFSLDQQTYAQLLEGLKEHFLESVGDEDCLKIFLDEADYLPPAISDKFFNKAVLAFDSQKSTNKVHQFFSDLFSGSSGSSSKTNNLIRLFSHCLREIQLEGLDMAGVIQAISQQATVANMMRFYRQLSELDRLESEVTASAEDVLYAVERFRTELQLGSLTLDTLGLLHKDDFREERLIALHECLTKVCPSERVEISTDRLKILITLRLEELAAFYKAADNIRKFAGRFDDVAESDTIGDSLAQFSLNPATVELRLVCQPREVAGQPIVLRLRAVSDQDLATVEQHNRLYESAVFRIIHDEVWQDFKRYNFSLNSTRGFPGCLDSV